MANGELFNMYALTAAHKTLPFGTCLLVTNHKTGTDVVVQIKDRGPFVRGREIDLSYQAAKDLGILGDGVGLVTIKNLGRDNAGNCSSYRNTSPSQSWGGETTWTDYTSLRPWIRPFSGLPWN